ncbi:hypothetical protein H072_9907 [Dactylellina haptotyla CBS 200.50]|uniref:Signal recognition particle subunit SRP68 n=1 Tax=Dactylellina haptotyla (strain CBS 200.50) TaxID=1284197 RepID=S8A0R4_DACHA|nr:hypothetical protein H072_9907 [Dactylellina haptotyla CBS 200.50]
MDITSTVLKLRSDPLLLGDYNAYRALCSRRISKLRRSLYGKSTSRSRKYVVKAAVTPENLAENPKYAHLLVYSAERAWAFAMYMKSDSGNSGLSGPTRSHIITRFHKAYKYATQLLSLLQDPESKAGQNDILEARAYADSIAGSVAFEKKQWEKALTHLSTARIIYLALSSVVRGDTFKDILSSNIDPAVRYSSYQLRLPRNQDIDTTSRQHFPKDDEKLLSAVKELDADILNEPEEVQAAEGTTVNAGTSTKPAAVRSITWRTRTAPVEDADVSIALGNVVAAEKNLESYLVEHKGDSGKSRADHFDEILAAWQESADVIKKIKDDALNDGASTDDERIQALQIIYTYVNYNLISWRIRRNSTMATGVWDDKKEKDGAGAVAGFKEEVALWDAILQDLEQATELPGVAADEEFGSELEMKKHYYLALKCSAIAASHANIGNRLNALALYHRASESIKAAVGLASQIGNSSNDAFSIPSDKLSILSIELKANTQRYHALAEMDRLTQQSATLAQKLAFKKPLIESLASYPEGGIDFSNLIDFPPKVKPIPVKPIFFDIAWNYVEYPGMEKEAELVTSAPSATQPMDVDSAEREQGDEQATPQRKGWFGWGR